MIEELSFVTGHVSLQINHSQVSYSLMLTLTVISGGTIDCFILSVLVDTISQHKDEDVRILKLFFHHSKHVD